MRDRLIELLQQADKKCDDTKQCENCVGFGKGGECVNHLIAEYLLAKGVIVPPYKVESKVYVITSQTSDNRNLYIFEDRITHYRICDGCTIMSLENHLGVPSWNWNKVFLTREEAERALAERSENGT